jgi:hypothetical protein
MEELVEEERVGIVISSKCNLPSISGRRLGEKQRNNLIKKKQREITVTLLK